MHISGAFSINEKVTIQSATSENSKCKNDTLELSILKILKTEPTATQKRIALS